MSQRGEFGLHREVTRAFGREVTGADLCFRKPFQPAPGRRTEGGLAGGRESGRRRLPSSMGGRMATRTGNEMERRGQVQEIQKTEEGGSAEPGGRGGEKEERARGGGLLA